MFVTKTKLLGEMFSFSIIFILKDIIKKNDNTHEGEAKKLNGQTDINNEVYYI